MNTRRTLLFVAIFECIAALVLHKLGLEFVVLLIGAAITYLIAEMLRP